MALTSAGVPTKGNYGALGTPHWFEEMSTSSAGLFGAHVETQMWTKSTDSLAHFLLRLLSNNRQPVFLEILHFAHSRDFSQAALESVHLPALSVRHDESITLAC